MQRLLTGAALGIFISGLLVVAAMLTGTPFRTVTLKYGAWKDATVVATPDFIVVYQNLPCNGGGSGQVTVAGQDGAVRAPWRGYVTGWAGSGPGKVDFLSTYDAELGTATISVNGRLLQIEQDGSSLRLLPYRFGLQRGPAVIVVGGDGMPKQLTDVQAAILRKSIPPWFTNGVVEAYPPAVATAAH